MHRKTVATAAASTGLALAGALLVAAPAIAGAGVFAQAAEVTALTDATPTTVPPGAAARLHTVNLPDGTSRWTLHVTGLAADRTYGAHAHVGTCAQAGLGHYRVGSPINAETEVWLDFRTNASGNGRSVALQAWQFTPEEPPRSVIIHRDPTNATTGPDAGKAGPKLACLDLQF